MSMPSDAPVSVWLPAGSRIDWYFDFISPFAYLQWQRLRREVPLLKISPRPVLFAGLLKHWDNKGPVEITPKRSWTYAHCLWIAHRHSIPMRLPAHHPFNPLPLLRLSIALGNSVDIVDRLFRFVWQEGHVPTDAESWQKLLNELNLTEEVLAADAVKKALVKNGETAIEQGVFGVPTGVVNDQCFWGVDGTDMMIACLQGDPFFSTEEWQRAHSLPEGQQRR